MWVAGIDGCPFGWVAVFRSTVGLEPQAKLFLTLDDAIASDQKPQRIAIDMPIGLPRISLRGGRSADREARKLLGRARQSSVFPAPSRATLAAHTFLEACDIELQHSQPPKKVSQQVFNIFGKMNEVDQAARRHPGLIYECHPEVTFCVMNDGSPMVLPKKGSKRKHPTGMFESGMDERRELLARNGFPRSLLYMRVGSHRDCGWDDQLDACAAAWTAERIFRGAGKRLPAKIDLDETGLDMAIWA